MNAVRMGVSQRSPEWLEARRSLVCATDLPAILGLSPWRSEWDVAQEKLGLAEPQDESLAMRKGTFLEPFILAEYAREHGAALSDGDLWVSGDVPWAGCSPDGFAHPAGGDRILVECKSSGSRARWADGLPQDYEAQVRWSLGVLGLARADVAALVGDELRVIPVEHVEATWADLLAVAADFRRRLPDGPFAHSAESVRRAFPADDGSEIAADADTAEAVRALLDVRAARKRMEGNEEALETAIKTRMADAALMRGPGFRVSWRRTRDGTAVEWAALATDLMASVPEPERAALVGRFTVVRPGFRPLRVTAEGEGE